MTAMMMVMVMMMMMAMVLSVIYYGRKCKPADVYAHCVSFCLGCQETQVNSALKNTKSFQISQLFLTF